MTYENTKKIFNILNNTDNNKTLSGGSYKQLLFSDLEFDNAINNNITKNLSYHDKFLPKLISKIHIDSTENDIVDDINNNIGPDDNNDDGNVNNVNDVESDFNDINNSVYNCSLKDLEQIYGKKNNSEEFNKNIDLINNIYGGDVNNNILDNVDELYEYDDVEDNDSDDSDDDDDIENDDNNLYEGNDDDDDDDINDNDDDDDDINDDNDDDDDDNLYGGESATNILATLSKKDEDAYIKGCKQTSLSGGNFKPKKYSFNFYPYS